MGTQNPIYFIIFSTTYKCSPSTSPKWLLWTTSNKTIFKHFFFFLFIRSFIRLLLSDTTVIFFVVLQRNRSSLWQSFFYGRFPSFVSVWLCALCNARTYEQWKRKEKKKTAKMKRRATSWNEVKCIAEWKSKRRLIPLWESMRKSNALNSMKEQERA